MDGWFSPLIAHFYHIMLVYGTDFSWFLVCTKVMGKGRYVHFRTLFPLFEFASSSSSSMIL
jgi:hypothetical protein